MSKWSYLKGTGGIVPHERKRTSEKELRDGPPDFRRFLRGLPCCLSERRGFGLFAVHGAHVVAVGSGGAGVPKWENNIVPLVCWLHVPTFAAPDWYTGPRLDQDRGKEAFERWWKCDLAAIARVVTEGFNNNWPPEEVRRRWKDYGGR